MMKSIRYAIAVAWLVFVSQGARAQTVVYVDDSAPTGGDGLSWATAFNNLQDTLDYAAAHSSVKEVRVGQGVYRPDQGGGNTPGDRNATFRLLNGVTLKGSYAGYGAEKPDERKFTDFASVLSGDLAGDDARHDGEVFTGYSENSYHVVTARGVNATAILDGFTILGGYAPEAVAYKSLGAGMLIEQSSPVIANCTLTANLSVLGSGACILNAEPVFTRCTIRRNLAWMGRGAGLYIEADSNGSAKTTRIQDSVFSGNKAYGLGWGGDGGAIFDWGKVTLVILRSRFEGNTAEATEYQFGDGGAICDISDQLIVENCIFHRNSAVVGGGVWTGGGNATLVNCVFSGNQALAGGAVEGFFGKTALINCAIVHNRADDGGGLNIHYTNHVFVKNSIFWGNTATNAAAPYKAQIHAYQGSATITYSCVEGLFTPGEGEDPPDPADFPGCIDANPLFINPLGPDGLPGTPDDDLRLLAGSPCIDAGDDNAVPLDAYDLDGNGITHEPIPVDLDNLPRFMGDGAVVDMGAYEEQTVSTPIATRITVPRVAGKPGKRVMLKATLERADTGAKLGGRSLTFQVEGITVGAAYTNALGRAKLAYTIPIGTAPGSKTVTVTFAGAGIFVASSGTGTLRVR